MQSRGTYLSDLTFIEDGNPDSMNDLINFTKREMVYNTIAEIKNFQQTGYNFPIIEPVHTFLLDLPGNHWISNPNTNSK